MQGSVLWYLTAFLAALGESTAVVGLLVPGVGAVIGISVLAARGEASLTWVGTCASLGAIAGFGVSYHLGRAGSRWANRWGNRTQAALGSAEAFFRRFGAWSVFWGHFFGPVRAFVALAAGSAGFPPKRFWAASVLGAVVWGYGLAVFGVFVSGGWALVETWLGRGSLLLGLAVVVLYFAFRIALGALGLGFRLFPPATAPILRLLAAAGAASWLERLRESHPRWVTALRRRLEPDHATGLLLTVGAVTCAAFAWLFFGVAEDLLFQDPLVRIDQNVFHLVQNFRTPSADLLFLTTTYLGGAAVLLAALGVGCAALAACGRHFDAVLLFGGFGAGEAVTWALKQAVGRARPVPASPLVVELSSAFPSSHAFSALVLYGFLAYVAGRGLRTFRGRARLYASAGVVVAAVGLSRLYLGVHWLSDVVAGYALGGIWLTALITSSEARERFGPERRAVRARRRWVAALTVACALLSAWGLETWRRLGSDARPRLTTAPLWSISPEEFSRLFSNREESTLDTLLGRRVGTVASAVAGREDDLLAATGADGWARTATLGADGLLDSLAGGVGRVVYPLFWLGRPQDLALIKPDDTGGRWIARLWRTRYLLDGDGPIWALDLRLERPRRPFLGVSVPTRPAAGDLRTPAPSLVADPRRPGPGHTSAGVVTLEVRPPAPIPTSESRP